MLSLCQAVTNDTFKLKNATNLRDIGVRVKPKDFGVIQGWQWLDVFKVLIQGFAQGDFIPSIKTERWFKHLLTEPDLNGTENRRNKSDEQLMKTPTTKEEGSLYFHFNRFFYWAWKYINKTTDRIISTCVRKRGRPWHKNSEAQASA